MLLSSFNLKQHVISFLFRESAPVQITMTNFPGVEAQENFPLLRSKTELFPTTSSGSLGILRRLTLTFPVPSWSEICTSILIRFMDR